jgi:hypothetical protein
MATTRGDKIRATRNRTRARKAGLLLNCCKVCGEDVDATDVDHDKSPWHIANMETE